MFIDPIDADVCLQYGIASCSMQDSIKYRSDYRLSQYSAQKMAGIDIFRISAPNLIIITQTANYFQRKVQRPTPPMH